MGAGEQMDGSEVSDAALPELCQLLPSEQAAKSNFPVSVACGHSSVFVVTTL